MPIAAVNFVLDKGKDYLRTKFSKDLEFATANIPPEHLIEPKLSIAGPALQGLAFSHEEDSLRTMYLNLLASSMNSERRSTIHPAFAELIRQLGAKDAKLLKDLSIGNTSHAIVRITLTLPDRAGKHVVRRHLLPYNFLDDSGLVYATSGDSDVPSILDNLCRLGIIAIEYGQWLTNEGAYDWVPTNPLFKAYAQEKLPSGNAISFDKGYLVFTDFGRSFVIAVLGPEALLKQA